MEDNERVDMGAIRDAITGSHINNAQNHPPAPIEPFLGMEFMTLEEGYNCYNAHANYMGFSVRRSSNNKDKAGHVVRKTYVCSREGKSKEKVDSVTKRLRGESRDGCRAKITFKETKEGTWKVVIFEDVHSHDLTSPSKVQFLRSHRNVSSVKKALIDTYDAANVRTSQQMGVFELQAGGFENIGCLEQDVRNYARDRREQAKGKDAQMLVDHFRELKARDPEFIFNIKKDHDNRVIHIFWADPIARQAYTNFGDAVTFDTTYKTNRYDMIFAPFTGVNHHRRSIILGCGLLSDESADSFSWLFEQWLAAMPGPPPKGIITDQDKGMKKAIAQVLPYTCHRLCIWHIMQKMPEKLGSVYNNVKKSIKSCIHNSESAEEFERRWNELLAKPELKRNEWLNDMYELRRQWIPAYLKDKFFAGMSSTQRSEGVNAFIKHYVSKKNSFCDFIIRYERAIAHQRHRQLKDDHETINTRPKLRTPWMVEKQMVDIYTKKIFLKFQDEVYFALSYVVKKSQEDDYNCLYEVRLFDESGDKLRDRDKHRLVAFDKETRHVVCSCHKFEFEGIPCRHLLCVLRHAQFRHLPPQYILLRWSRHARAYVNRREDVAIKGTGEDSLVARHSILSQFCNRLVNEGALSVEAFECAISEFARIEALMRDLNSKVVTVETTYNRKESAESLQYEEPSRCKTKGSGKRIKSSREKRQKKGRRCSGCKKSDVSHDRRTCLALMDTAVIEEAPLIEKNQSTVVDSIDFFESNDDSEDDDYCEDEDLCKSDEDTWTSSSDYVSD